MKQTFLFVVLLLTAAISLHAQTAHDAAKLTTILNEFLAGAGRNDAAVHDRFWADDLIYTRSVGVRTNKPEMMRKAFDETVKAIKSDGKERREIDDQIAELRSAMIEAFTKLKDYDSAIEQHIEIINREPENEQLTDNAVAYVRRYGGAEKLLNY